MWGYRINWLYAVYTYPSVVNESDSGDPKVRRKIKFIRTYGLSVVYTEWTTGVKKGLISRQRFNGHVNTKRTRRFMGKGVRTCVTRRFSSLPGNVAHVSTPGTVTSVIDSVRLSVFSSVVLRHTERSPRSGNTFPSYSTGRRHVGSHDPFPGILLSSSDPRPTVILWMVDPVNPNQWDGVTRTQEEIFYPQLYDRMGGYLLRSIWYFTYCL